MENMRRELMGFARWLDGDVLLTASRSECERFLAERGQVSPATAHVAWRALRSFYAFLAEEDDIPNPMRHVKAPRVPEPATKVATQDEYDAMMTYLDRQAKRVGHGGTGFEYRRAKAMLALLWDTGLRRGELQALRVDDFDLETSHLTVRRSKTGKPRIVPFTPNTTRLLYQYLRWRDRHDFADDPCALVGAVGTAGHRWHQTGHRARRRGRGREHERAGVQACLRSALAVEGWQPGEPDGGSGLGESDDACEIHQKRGGASSRG